jgi:hypothetical protein
MMLHNELRGKEMLPEQLLNTFLRESRGRRHEHER